MGVKLSQKNTFPNYQIYSCKMQCTMEEAEDALREALKSQKFGVVSTVDVQKTIKKKTGNDIRPYVIIGACNPSHAYKVINLEKDVGLLLPCNILLQEKEQGVVTFGFMNPRIIDIFTKNSEITKIVDQVIIELAKVAQKLDPDYIKCKGIPIPKKKLVHIFDYQKGSIILKKDMDNAYDRLRTIIAAEKFGIVSVVDVQKTISKKIGKVIQPYIIIGICNPPQAFKAINIEEDIGLLMPCNVLLQEIEPGTVKVGFQNPLMIETLTQNAKLNKLLQEVDRDIYQMVLNLQKFDYNKIREQEFQDSKNKMMYVQEAQNTKKFPNVFMEIQFEGKYLGRIEFELFSDTPKTSYNFKCLCTGEKKINYQQEMLEPVKLTYKGSRIHKIIPQFMIQGGDITRGDGSGGDSIYGVAFPDENFVHKHDKPYMLSMGNRGEPNTNSSQFYITLKPCIFLDNSFVCFGQVINGQKVVKKLEGYGQKNGEVRQKIIIKDCGVCE